MRVIQVTEQDRSRYDAFISSSPLADVMQSYAWGEVKRASGRKPLRLLVEDDDGRARAACSLLRMQVAPGIPPLLYAPRGPVLDYADTEALRALLAAIKDRSAGAFALKCDPPIERGSPAGHALVEAGFRRVSGGPFGGVQPTAVMVLDIDAEEDKILERFKSKWRYNIRLAERKGVVIREGSREDIATFYDILVETARRDGFVIRGRTYFETLWRELEPCGSLKVFLAEHEGTAIAGIMLMMMGDRAVYVYGASSNERRNLMPNHLIQWTAIRWAREAGYKIYDFRGVSPVRNGEPTQPQIAGLNRFKEGFGARYVEYEGEFDLPLRAAWYAGWRYGAPVAMKVRKKLRGAAPQAD